MVSEGWSENIFITKITMGNNSVNLVQGLTFIVRCISSDHMLYLYQVSRRYLERFQSYGGTQFQDLLIQRGIILQTLYAELQFLYSVECLVMVYICTRFHENILNDLRVIERTHFQY